MITIKWEKLADDGFIKSLKNDTIKLYENYIDFDKNVIDVNIFENIVKQINDNIKNFKNNNFEKNEIEKMVSNSVNCIKIFSDIKDNVSFMVLYKKYLKERLLNNFDNDIENILINSFSNKSNIDLFIQMKLMINDIYQSNQINKVFENNNLKLNIVSEKYKNLDIQHITHSIKYFNQYLWEDYYPKYNINNLPLVLDFFVNIYKKFTQKLFNEKKTFDVNGNANKEPFTHEFTNV